MTPLLALIDSVAKSPVEYVVGGARLLGNDREIAAQLLAEDSMLLACGSAPALDWWRSRRAGGPSQTGSKLKSLEAIVSIAFGLPASEKNTDHIQGHIAELFWGRLIEERKVCRDGRSLVQAHPVKIDALEPGGDGLVVYKDCDDSLVFRLWEIKKHDSTNNVSATIGRASSQLADRGHQYLAKLVGPATLSATDPEIADLYDNMIELWYDRSERSGIGVAIGTSDHHAPGSHKSFGTLRKRFPEFTKATQTEGIVVAIPDFPGFAERVKEIVWSGL